jgi:hypothetical protein
MLNRIIGKNNPNANDSDNAVKFNTQGVIDC